MLRLASAKASAAPAHSTDIVVGADTTVALNGRILNKPRDDDDAFDMLRALSGAEHHVHTGYCVRRAEVVVADVVTTKVRFRELHDDEIAAYLARGEHRDKAGAYAIQGEAAALVDRVEGSLTNVIGLPVTEVLAALRRVSEAP